MDSYNLLVLKRSLRTAIDKYARAVEKTEPGSDLHEIMQGALVEAKEILKKVEEIMENGTTRH